MGSPTRAPSRSPGAECHGPASSAAKVVRTMIDSTRELGRFESGHARRVAIDGGHKKPWITCRLAGAGIDSESFTSRIFTSTGRVRTRDGADRRSSREAHMAQFKDLDLEPRARLTFAIFLIAEPSALVEGLFEKDGSFWIVCPNLATTRADGKTIAEWFAYSVRPAAHPIDLRAKRPEGARLLEPCSPDEMADGYGIARSLEAERRFLAMLLPTGFPLDGIRVDDRELYVQVERELTAAETESLHAALDRTGEALPVHVEVTGGAPKAYKRGDGIDLTPVRLLSGTLPEVVRASTEEDEAFWRDNYRRVLRGQLPLAAIVSPRDPTAPACLVATTFPTENVRSYLSLYSSVVLHLPLADRVDSVLQTLGISRRDLLSLVSSGHVSFVAPQSIDRYDASFLADILSVSRTAVTLSRRLAAAAWADQFARNPIFTPPSDVLHRRAILRVIGRIADAAKDPHFSGYLRAFARSLSEAWQFQEYSLHTRGAMAALNGPLARVATGVMEYLSGKNFFIELGSSATSIEWASALGLHYAPFVSDSFSELGHCEVLLAFNTGAVRGRPLAQPTEFKVAEDLLVLDMDADVNSLVRDLGTGDLARFRTLVRDLAVPCRPQEELADLVRDWNDQVRRYSNRRDRVRSMGLVGAALGAATALGVPPLQALSAALVPALVTLFHEELAAVSASVGIALDEANAKLAMVSIDSRPIHRDAVLLARMRTVTKK